MAVLLHERPQTAGGKTRKTPNLPKTSAVVALFAAEKGATLPLVIQRLMGAYRMEAAAGAALLLVAAAFVLFWICDLWGRGGAET